MCPLVPAPTTPLTLLSPGGPSKTLDSLWEGKVHRSLVPWRISGDRLVGAQYSEGWSRSAEEGMTGPA